MIKTKSLVASISDVPAEWIFETYADLPERLTGQNVRIKSLFNPKDNDPSMFIFCKGGLYFFKDFSTDLGGTSVEFVSKLKGITIGEAINLIVEDYKNFLQLKNHEYKRHEIIPRVPFTLESYEVRPWNRADAEYWLGYGIDSKILNRYNIKPLKSFIFSKTENCEYIFYKTEKMYTYGFFKKDGTLFKIYQPKTIEKKFMVVSHHIQGLDQLEYKQDTLVICSSLKDGMSLLNLHLPVEFIAPDSENAIFDSIIINNLKRKYKRILCCLDNDEAGIKAMQKYKELYDIDSLLVPLEKDVADSVKKHGRQFVRSTIIKLL